MKTSIYQTTIQATFYFKSQEKTQLRHIDYFGKLLLQILKKRLEVDNDENYSWRTGYAETQILFDIFQKLTMRCQRKCRLKKVEG